MKKNFKNDQKKFRTDISKAKGLGAAHDGVHHWLAQRFSSVLIMLLLTWMVLIIICIANQSLNEIIEIVKKPYNVLGITLFTIVSFYHANLGMQVIIEDYSHCRAMRLLLLYLIKILSIVTASAVIVALFYLMSL